MLSENLKVYELVTYIDKMVSAIPNKGVIECYSNDEADYAMKYLTSLGYKVQCTTDNKTYSIKYVKRK